jgi:hypothetical protein
MKFFEKIAGAELAELKRIAAAIAKKNKKIKKVIDVPIKLIPQDKKAKVIADGQEAIAKSRYMLYPKKIEKSEEGDFEEIVKRFFK